MPRLNAASSPKSGKTHVAVNIQQLLEILPHRYPILLVDRILEHSPEGDWCKAIKNVTINEAFFQGHYPGFPVMPGVLIVEAMAQTGAAITLTRPDAKGMIPLIGAIDDVKFRKMVTPGDQLVMECQLLWLRGSIGRMKCHATVDGELAASMELTFKLIPREF